MSSEAVVELVGGTMVLARMAVLCLDFHANLN
jgi:hypothetical protein